MNASLENFRDRIEEDLRFLKGWILSPSGVGSVTPTGKAVARAMASCIPAESDCPVLELGPGTGVITDALIERGIAPSNIVSVEYSEDFYRYLVKRYPAVNFIHGDGFRIKELVRETRWQRFRGVIGAIPLLNFPKETRARLVADCLDLVEPGGCFVQISYGLRAPTPAVPGKISLDSTEWIMKNVPPARVYVYRSVARPRHEN